MKYTRHILLALSLLTVATANGAPADKYYKWVDDKGGVHYSARPPRDRPAQRIKVAPESARPAAAPTSTTPAKPGSVPAPADATTAPQANTASQSTADAKALAAEAAANCEIARKNLNALNTRARVRIKDEKTGEFRFLTAEEHAQWVKDSETGVRDNCR